MKPTPTLISPKLFSQFYFPLQIVFDYMWTWRILNLRQIEWKLPKLWSAKQNHCVWRFGLRINSYQTARHRFAKKYRTKYTSCIPTKANIFRLGKIELWFRKYYTTLSSGHEGSHTGRAMIRTQEAKFQSVNDDVARDSRK